MARVFRKYRLARLLSPERIGPMAWLEAPLLVVAAVGIGFLVRPDDPLIFTGGIRWSIVVVLVVALRYGSLIGSTGMFTLVALWFVCQALGLYPGMPFPELTFLGGYIIVLITGEFADMWRVRLMRAESQAAYAEERLRNLTQRHVLLRLSHDRLEENLLVKPYTVRDALLRLRDVVMDESHHEALPGGEELLNLLAEYCQLQRGGLYRVKNGRAVPEPVALLGNNSPLDQGDQMLRHALDYRLLTHVQTGETMEGYKGHYWVCAPVMNSGGELIGVVVVERMPFLSIHHENLQLFGLLLNFYADVVHHGPVVDELCDIWPDLPPVFGREFEALRRLAEARKVDTTVLLLSPDESEQARQIVSALNRHRRAMDGYWWVDWDGYVLMLLMPTTGVYGFESYLRRIEQWLKEDFGMDTLAQAGIQYTHRFLDERPVKEQLRDLLGEAHV
ncbi:PelD GGDEF domain-containing protein [Alloalcanivorax marinus]|uniref:PelD GGDEF domain-containing protein n=1 Tax=Alloalcanivorax marinus TaxID=1177169 RepID=UPI001931E26B|nr:PelD GGDEF domain-containing protein [Alloalcanivorax marinus]MBL7251333.1 GAF domain-containing protein [Alloalcanivorax marinus]